jgi:XTP/dITP diphosphohydrolase
MMQPARTLAQHRTLVLATHNVGKLREMQALLAPLGFEVLAVSRFESEPVEETASTFVENALIKARAAARASGLPAIADDSGIEVDALGGAPGVRSARFAGEGASDAENLASLLAALSHVEDVQRTARFRCAAVYLEHPEHPTPIICEAHWEGSIARAPRGKGGFGYDPVFLDRRTGTSAAELGVQDKNRISHRGQALRALVTALRAMSQPRSQ